ncbi:5-hydroxytryptamine receptor 4-like [Diadema antillarum]|uniref:5-hydroxytryptamine receptor 4-like n=1 Tax=Diadema antillarum TaxID=105358 RepID=UPI003A8B3781
MDELNTTSDENLDSVTADQMWTKNVTPTSEYPTIYAHQYHAIIVATITFLIGVTGIIGNCLVLVAISLSKKLQTSTNAFVSSLSVSDFLTSTILPFQAIGISSQTGWPLAPQLCHLIAAVGIQTNSTSILTLTAIAVNRYVTITRSRRLQQRIYTPLGIAAMIGAVWAFPFFSLVILQLFPKTGGLVYDPVFRSCIWDLNHPVSPVFQGIASLTFVICTIIIIFCYVAIYVFVRRHVTGMQTRMKSNAASTETLEADDGAGQEMQTKRTPSVKQINITKNLAIVVGVFFVCVLPYSLNLYVREYYISTAYLGLLLVLPAALNPFIYAAKHPDFKIVFKCMFSCRYSDIPKPSGCLKAISQQDNTTSSSKNTSSV